MLPEKGEKRVTYKIQNYLFEYILTIIYIQYIQIKINSRYRTSLQNILHIFYISKYIQMNY